MLLPVTPLTVTPSPLFTTPGLRKFAWLRRLKNSARNSSFIRSPMRAVVFENAKSKFTYPGPRSEFLARVPYVDNDGSATTWESDGNTVALGTHAGTEPSTHRALLKLAGLTQ